MKRLLIFVFGMLLFFSGCEDKNTTTKSTQLEQINIGVIAPLTGEYASYGKSVKRGINLAYKSLSDKEKSKINIIYQDSKMDAKTGINALSSLINSKTKIVIGPFGSGIVLATSKLANKSKVTLISASATADKIEDAGEYIFRTVPKNKVQGSSASHFILNNLNIKEICILHETTDYGYSLRDSFIATTKGKGKIKLIESYKRGDTDFRNQIIKIKNAKCKAVYFPGAYTENALILKQARELGLDMPFIGADGGFSDKLIEVAKESTKNSYFTFMYVDENNEYQKFKKKLKKEYNVENDVFALYYYDLANMIFSKLDELSKQDNIPNYLINMKAYTGLTGKVKFNSKGEIEKGFGVYAVEKNGFKIIK